MWRPLLTTLRAWRYRPPAAPAPPWLVAAAYAGFPLVSLAVVLFAMRVTSVDHVTQAPLLNYHDGDTLLILPMVKDAVEQGTHWHNDRMGAPGTFQLYDFPVIDHLHFACLWLVGLFVGSYVTAFNVYFLLTYPLTTLTTLGVFRRFGFSLPAAGAAGLLYAFLYYHAGRGQAHYFLSAYWVIPLSMLLVLRVTRGEPPFTETRDGALRWAVRWREALGMTLIAILSALGGAYYAFFTCAFLGFAGVYGSVAARSWKPLVSAAVLLGVVTAAGVAAHAPMFAYHAAHGKNSVPSQRQAMEAEWFGLKIGHLLLPQTEHQWQSVGRFAASYHEDGRPVPSENKLAPVGVVASVGVVVVGVVFLLPGPHRWPYGQLGALVVFAILFSTIGGLGALFNFFVTPQVRAYSRMSVFIAFFGLFASLWVLDQWLPPFRGLRWVLFLALAAFGILDQTPRPWFRPEIIIPRERNLEQYTMDAAFFAQVEEAVPGGMVFALPHLAYPENVMRHRMSSAYRFAAGYLHTRTVRWSFGSMRAREINQWQEEVAADPVPLMTRRLVASGFDAVCVDVFGYTEEEGKKLVAELTALCGPPLAAQSDGSRLLFDLRPLRARLVKESGGDKLALDGVREAEAVRLLFVENFISAGRTDVFGRVRCVGVLYNPSARDRLVHVSFRHVWTEGMREDTKELKLTITSAAGWSETIEGRHGETSVRPLAVPPGSHRVAFRCLREYSWFDRLDPRLCFGLCDVRVTEP